jgi:hypothetical protein
MSTCLIGSKFHPSSSKNPTFASNREQIGYFMLLVILLFSGIVTYVDKMLPEDYQEKVRDTYAYEDLR